MCQSEASLQSDAAVHEELAVQQRWAMRRVGGWHPGWSVGRGWRRPRLQLDGLSAAYWKGTSIPSVLPEGLTHAACLEEFIKTDFLSWSDVTGCSTRPSQSSSIPHWTSSMMHPLPETLQIHFYFTVWESSLPFTKGAICKPCWWTWTWVQKWALPSAVSSVYIALSSA